MRKNICSIIGWFLVCSIISVPTLYVSIKYGKPIASMYYDVYNAENTEENLEHSISKKVAVSFPSDYEHKGVSKMKELLSVESNYGGIVPLISHLTGYIAVCSEEPQISYIEVKSDVEHIPHFQAFIDNDDKTYNANNTYIYFKELISDGYITITEGRAVDTTAVYTKNMPAEIVIPDNCDIALGDTIYVNLGIYNDDNREFFIKAIVVGKAKVNDRLPIIGSTYQNISYFDGSFENNSHAAFISDISSVYNVFHKGTFNSDNNNAETYIISYKEPEKSGISDEKIIDAAKASGGSVFFDYQKLISSANMIETRIQAPMTILVVVNLFAGVISIILFIVQTLNILIKFKKQKQS